MVGSQTVPMLAAEKGQRWSAFCLLRGASWLPNGSQNRKHKFDAAQGLVGFRSYRVYISLSEKTPKLSFHTFWKFWFVAQP
jgi:hypothetical protein